MRLEIDIPEWADKSRIIVLAGIECIADFNPLVDPDNVFVKEIRCNMCAACCDDCEHVHPKHKYCMIASKRFVACCYDPNIGREEPKCCITHKKVPIIK